MQTWGKGIEELVSQFPYKPYLPWSQVFFLALFILFILQAEKWWFW